jgi:osmotically-inducible protein OsmY
MTGTLQASYTERRDDPDLDRQEQHDEELRKRVVTYLTLRAVPGLESVRLTVSRGTVVLWGDVPSPSAKWRCYECCRYVAGVINVIDRLIVIARKRGFERPGENFVWMCEAVH